MIQISILGRPTEGQRVAFKQAKANLGISEPMVFAPAGPGCDRAIIFARENEDPLPEFACRWITLYRDNQQDVDDTLAWYVGRSVDWRQADIDLWLERVLERSGVREVAA